MYSDCSVDGNAGNGTAQGTCPNGLLCYADGTCHGKLWLIFIHALHGYI